MRESHDGGTPAAKGTQTTVLVERPGAGEAGAQGRREHRLRTAADGRRPLNPSRRELSSTTVKRECEQRGGEVRLTTAAKRQIAGER